MQHIVLIYIMLCEPAYKYMSWYNEVKTTKKHFAFHQKFSF